MKIIMEKGLRRESSRITNPNHLKAGRQTGKALQKCGCFAS